ASANSADLLAYTEKWPQEARKQFKQALKEDKPFTILLAGSDTNAASKNGWATLVKDNIEKTYGEAVILKTLEFDMNSFQFVNGEHQKELAAEKADLLILEPFILKDDGVVPTEDSLAHLETILASVRNENPD